MRDERRRMKSRLHARVLLFISHPLILMLPLTV